MTIIKIARFKANDNGRDFVIGDLHGCPTLLERLLDQVSFDPAADRVFSVGDIADRGPEPMAALSLLDEPWFHAVRGNHEDNLLSCFDIHAGKESISNCWNGAEIVWGNEWLAEEITEDFMPSSALQQALDKIQDLPYIITVGDGAKRFNIVHAGLYFSFFDHHQDMRREGICLDSDIDNGFKNSSEDQMHALINNFTLGRELFKQPSGKRRVGGLSTTYCGHTVHNQVMQEASHINLDTGAYLSAWKKYEGEYRLTMAQANSDLLFTTDDWGDDDR
jgi:serine/threonine protein phosphatase 1